MAYFAAFRFGFFDANRSVFLRRAARFLILSLPRLCPITRQINVLNQSGKSRMMSRRSGIWSQQILNHQTERLGHVDCRMTRVGRS
jgi:hypothetical protein